MGWVGIWAGGKVWADKTGERRYHLRRRVNGRNYLRVLDARTESEALAEYDKFRLDPDLYFEIPDQAEERPDLAPSLVADYIEHQRRLGRTSSYISNLITYLSWWHGVLKHRALSDVNTVFLKRMLERESTATKARIIAIKSYGSWLRVEKNYLTAANDPTLGLKVPPPRPAKVNERKGISMRRLEQFYPAIEWQDVRDSLLIRAKTGMHETELNRLAVGEGLLREVRDPCGIYGVVKFVHKNGRVHLQSLDVQAFAAAQRIAGRGKPIDNSRIRRAIIEAAIKLRTDPWNAGELRHSFVTWSRESGELVQPSGRGVALDRIAEIIGHTSKRTTQRYYDNTEVPPMVRLPLKLFHPADPRAEE